MTLVAHPFEGKSKSSWLNLIRSFLWSTWLKRNNEPLMEKKRTTIYLILFCILRPILCKLGQSLLILLLLGHCGAARFLMTSYEQIQRSHTALKSGILGPWTWVGSAIMTRCKVDGCVGGLRFHDLVAF